MPDFEDFWNFEDEDTYRERQALAEQPAAPIASEPVRPQQPGFNLGGSFEGLGENIFETLGSVIGNSPPGLMARGAMAGLSSAPVQTAMDYMGRPAEALRTGFIDLSETMEPGDFFSGLGRGWSGEGNSLLDVYHRRGIQGPLTDAIAIGGDLALDPLNFAGLGSGLARSLRLGSLAGRRGELAGGLIAGAQDFARIRAEIENPTQLAKVVQHISTTPGLGTLGRFTDLISPGILAGAGDAADIARSRLAHIELVSRIPDQEEKARAGMEWMRRRGTSFEEISRIVTENMDALRSEFEQARLTLPREFRKRWELPPLEKPLPLNIRGELPERSVARPEPVSGFQGRLDVLDPQSTAWTPPSPPKFPTKVLPAEPTDWLDPTKSLDDILIARIVQVRNAIADMELFKAVLPYAELDAAEGTVTKGLFSGLKFSADDYKVLRELVPSTDDATLAAVKRVPEQLGRALEIPAGLQRTTALGADQAWGGLQGLLLLGRHPDDWLKTLGESMQAIKDPKVWYEVAGSPEGQYVLEHTPGLIWEGIHSGIKPEFYSSSELIGKIPGIGPGLQAVYDRLGTAYVTSGNLARFYWARGELASAEKADMVPQMVDFINHATGVINTQGMGVPASQRAIEGGILLLAPRYLRSVLAVTGDILNSGAAPEAIKTISSMIIGGTYAYTRLAEAAGQEPIYDLRDSRAYTVDVAGERVGIGSAVRALAAFGARLASDPESLLTGPDTNPFLQFWRARLPLGPSALWDLAMHEDFRHNNIANPFDFVKIVGEKFVPTAVDGLLIERGNGLQKAIGFAASVFGARTNPETISDIRDVVSHEKFQKDYLDLGPVERRAVDNDERAQRGPLPTGPTFERQRQIQYAHNSYKRDVEAVATAYYERPPQTTGAALRKRIGDFAERRNNSLEDIDRNLPAPRQGPALTEAIAADRLNQEAFKHYLKLLRDENVITGFVDRAAAEDYKTTRPQATQDYIDERFLAAAEGLGPNGRRAALELRKARDTLQPYWELRQHVMERAGVWDQYINMNTAEQKAYEESRHYRTLETRWARDREIMRRRSRDVDKALIKFYGVKPILGRQYSEEE